MINLTRIDGRQAGGMWVSGTVGEFRFQALVFHQHSEYELNGSRISKLWLQHNQPQDALKSIADLLVIANDFSVHVSNVSRIILRKAWKHI